MLKKEFTFNDFEGKEKTITAYFHLNKNDCVDLDFAFQEDGGLIEYLKTIMREAKENPDFELNEKFVRFIRLLVTKSYGERPKYDPTLFLKEDDYGRPLVRNFKGTPAYDQFVYDLLTGKESLNDFADGVLPEVDAQQRDEARKMLEKEGILDPVLQEVPKVES